MAGKTLPQWARLTLVVAGVALVTVLLRLTGLANHTTVALGYLLLMLPIAAFWGLLEATAASILSTLCFNFFFLPPTGTFTIAETENWIALSAFLVVSIAASQISERARRRSAESGAQFKDTLLDALAHELKTPLTSLKAAATSLQGAGANEPPNEELIAIVREETDRLDQLISEVLQMARVDAGKLRLDRRPCDVAQLLADAVREAQRYAGSREIKIQTLQDLPAVFADAELVQTVLRNLLDNALKYSASGKPLRIATELREQHVCVSVTDQGFGISEDELSRIFERGYRSPATRDSVAGAGLGLAIARDIVRAHGGRIWAESSPGEGSRFSFILPVAGETRG